MKVVSIFLILFRARTKIYFIVKFDVLVFIRWSYRDPDFADYGALNGYSIPKRAILS